MHVRRQATHAEVFAPAKLNLFLEILGKRPDGFHEIDTLMTPVSLYDTLMLAPTDDGRIELTCEQSVDRPCGDDAIPTGRTNIVVRALDALRNAADVSQGASVRLIKRIPMAAGMAGGSTDAAAALAAANVAWNLNWPAARLAELAASLGSDVPFFFARTAAVCRGRGEQIEPLVAPNSQQSLVPLDFVVVKPPVGLSTADVYRACKPAATPESSAAMADAWRRGDKTTLGRLLHNRLQDAAEHLCDWIDRLARESARFACLGHRMSGSGTSYFALCRNARQARRMAAELAGRGLGRTFALRTACGGGMA